MVEDGTAEPSCSSWMLPRLLAVKSDSSALVCTDVRNVNSVTTLESFPLGLC